MRHHRLLVVVSVVAIAVSVIGGTVGIAVRAAQARQRATVTRSAAASSISSPLCHRWAAYAGPSIASTFDTLTAVTEVPGSRQLWAVGQYTNTSTTLRQTLIEHFDGTSWSIVPSPSVTAYDNYLVGVTAVSANDVWAVGYVVQNTISQTLTEHWDGTAWMIVSSPNPYPSESRLFATARVSANDVWAVGYYLNVNVGLRQTLVEQWDGSKWNVVPSPNGSVVHRTVSKSSGPYSGVQGQNYLYGVSAFSTSDAWAVGANGFGTLTEHWNGTSWSVISSPSISNSFTQLASVAIASSSDVMAVGAVSPTSGGSAQTLVEHWNGMSWSIVPSPNPSATSFNALRSVAAFPGTNRFVAVGSAATSNVGPPLTLAEQWNGSSWSIVPTPNLGAYANDLNGIVAGTSGEMWAVGDFSSSVNGPSPTLIEHYVPNAMGITC